MSDVMKREVSFFINILSAVISGLVLAYILSVNSKLDETQRTFSELRVTMAQIHEYIRYDQENMSRIEQQQNRIDEIQRSRTSTFEGMQKYLDSVHGK